MDISDVEPLAPVISSRHELLIKHVDRYRQIRSSLRKPTGWLQEIASDGKTVVFFLLIEFVCTYRHFYIEGILSKETIEHVKDLQILELNDSQNATLTLIQDIFIPGIGITFFLSCRIRFEVEQH